VRRVEEPPKFGVGKEEPFVTPASLSIDGITLLPEAVAAERRPPAFGGQLQRLERIGDRYALLVDKTASGGTFDDVALQFGWSDAWVEGL
jgi:hypothetical protein